MHAWILSEPLGTYAWTEVDTPEPGTDRRTGPSRGERAEPHGPLGDQGVAPAAVAPRRRIRRGRHRGGGGRLVEDLAVGDEVVCNPAISPEAVVREYGIDSPLGPGLELLGENRWGGHAEAVVLPARNVVPRPAGRTWEECAAYPMAALTAWRMLRRARAHPGRPGAGRRVRKRGLGGRDLVGPRRGRRGARDLHEPRQAPTCPRDGRRRRVRVRRGLAREGRRRVRERRPGHLGPQHPSLAPGWPTRGVRRHLGSGRDLEHPEALLQAVGDHRLDDGQLHRVRPGDRPGRARPAGPGRRGLPPRALPRGARAPRRSPPARQDRAAPPGSDRHHRHASRHARRDHPRSDATSRSPTRSPRGASGSSRSPTTSTHTPS